MELIAASRIVKAQQRVAAAVPYSEQITTVIANLAAGGTSVSHPLLREAGDVRKVGVVVLTSDRGLAGAYNSTVIRSAERVMVARRLRADAARSCSTAWTSHTHHAVNPSTSASAGQNTRGKLPPPNLAPTSTRRSIPALASATAPRVSSPGRQFMRPPPDLARAAAVLALLAYLALARAAGNLFPLSSFNMYSTERLHSPGRIVARGRHSELLAASPAYRELLQVAA